MTPFFLTFSGTLDCFSSQWCTFRWFLLVGGSTANSIKEIPSSKQVDAFHGSCNDRRLSFFYQFSHQPTSTALSTYSIHDTIQSGRSTASANKQSNSADTPNSIAITSTASQSESSSARKWFLHLLLVFGYRIWLSLTYLDIFQRNVKDFSIA